MTFALIHFIRREEVTKNNFESFVYTLDFEAILTTSQNLINSFTKSR